ncbi:hypothetical protein LC613_36790 [Nostoc sphaeroides CHAB 2801]|uniref:hypothetical protein n=1 Tax=Nostoc sphaeroides TaxID=446679 RepID=UPI001E52F010|nr:hypothetical protein [Nostoc sphaeroides]MCC5633080.1 hypothetical protein [Nostoc sphaeroides CHAB 2801]
MSATGKAYALLPLHIHRAFVGIPQYASPTSRRQYQDLRIDKLNKKCSQTNQQKTGDR